MPAITIKNAILHILRNDGRPSVYSENELDIDSEVCEAFIGKHVKKLMSNPSAREAVFKPDAALYGLFSRYYQGGVSFKEMAATAAGRLDELMNRHVNITPSDLLIARVDAKSGEYLAIIKLNYTECYTHAISGDNAAQDSSGGDSDNQLIKYGAVLPFGGKVIDACLISLGADAMPLRVWEKPAVIDGESVSYFSTLFLECETAPSIKETAQIIDEITTEFVQEYFNNSPKAAARMKTALIEETEEAAAEDNAVSMENVAARVFADNDEVKRQYVETLRESGIRADVPLTLRISQQQFGTQRIKAENGIEIKLPAELAADGDMVDITDHADGTVTVVLKRLKMV